MTHSQPPRICHHGKLQEDDSRLGEPGPNRPGLEGPYTKWLGSNAQSSAANGFVTMDIARQEVNVEYYAGICSLKEGTYLYPVKNDMTPSYSFKIKTHAR